MAFDFSTLITDRSPEDLQALRDLLATPMADWTAEELAEFNQAVSKGAYNYTNLNRVIAAMDDINERLTAAGYETGYHPIIVHPVTPPEPVGPLPDGYTQLEYIQSSGTQYVDTGIKPNQDTIFRLKFAMTDISADYAMFGCRDTTSSGMFVALNRSNTFRISIAASIGRFVEYSADATQVTDLSLRHGTVTIEGTTEDVSSDPFQCSYNCLLFAASNGGTPAWKAHMKLYGCEIYDGSTLIRNFIPCKSPSGKVGLYDKVTNQFYGNSGTGDFIAKPLAKLPDGYIELVYIESTGTQYINTGFLPNQNTEVKIDFEPTVDISSSKGIFGSRTTSAASDEYSVDFYTDTRIRSIFGNDTKNLTILGVLKRFLIDKNKNICTINGEVLTNSSKTFQGSYPIYLLDKNTGGKPWSAISAKLYSCQIYDNGTLVRDFIPCKNDSNEIGLFDISQGVFHGNNGTGSFVAGPEVQPAPDPEPEPGFDPYTWYESDAPTVSLMDEYLANVSALRAVLDLPETTPAVPADMDRLTHAEANDIEAILDIINTYFVSLQSILLRCGAVVCGGPKFYFAN